MPPQEAVALLVAVGIGLLLGLERERRKGEGQDRAAAGIRTFALVGLLGSVTQLAGNPALPILAGAFVASAALTSYWKSPRSDPGIKTEVALVTTFGLGVLTQSQPALAAAAAVLVTILLASRSALHRLVRDTLTEQEFHDALIMAAAALVILPIVPDRGFGPYDAFNPFTAWRLVVIVMAVNGAGYIAQKTLGTRAGLPLAGFLGGFVSSTATIAAMAIRSRAEGSSRAAVAAAVLSTVATMLQLVLLVAAVSPQTLQALAPSLAAGTVLAGGYSWFFARRSGSIGQDEEIQLGRPFNFRMALLLAATVTAIMVGSTVLLAKLGDVGLVAAAALGGLADAHAAAISISSLVAAGRVTSSSAVIPILLGVSANALTKLAIAAGGGSRRFAVEVSIGVVLVVAALWAPVALPLRV